MSGRLLTAAGVSAALVLSTPYIGQIRSAVQSAFPDQYRAIVAGIIGSALIVALGLAVVRIRERRALRYGALVAAIGIAVLYALAARTGQPDRDLIERFHFVEYGLLTFLFYRAWRPRGDAAALGLPVCAGLLVGVADEWFQWFVPTRVGELSDVLINSVAVACGLLFSVGVDPPSRAALTCGASCRRAMAAGFSAVVVAAAIFVDAVHLGHEIRVSDAGVFRSAFSEAALRAAAADRAERWRRQPPVTVPGIAYEDHYLSEGLWHVQRRNEAFGDGNPWAAWNENLVLERFYTPVLDVGSRWLPEQRADTAALVAGRSGMYVSDAEPYPIFTLPRLQFWLTIAGIVLAIGLASMAGPRPSAGAARV